MAPDITVEDIVEVMAEVKAEQAVDEQSESHEGQQLCHKNDEWYNEDEMFFCSQTSNWYHNDYRVEYDDDYVCTDWADRWTFVSDSSGTRYHNDNKIVMDNGDKISEGEFENEGFCCDGCDRYLYNDDYNEDGYCYGCRSNDDLEEAREYAHGKVQSTRSDCKPKLSQTTGDDMIIEIIDHLDDHYSKKYGYSSIKRNVRKEIKSSGEVKLSHSSLSENMHNIYYMIRERNILGPYQSLIGRVRETAGDGLKIEYDYIDKFGNKKVRIEPIKKMYDYGFATLHTKDELETLQTYYKRCEKKICNLRWEMGNALSHKALFRDQTMETCQTGGLSEYSIGLADLFTNDCNLLLFVWDGDNIDGRMLVRLFYDDAGKEYLFLDRFYTNGKLSNNQKKILGEITGQLLDQGYNVVVSSTSEHTASNHSNLMGIGGFMLTPVGQSLRQPTRSVLFNSTAYYSDSGIRTWTTDGVYYDKAPAEYLHLVTKM